MNFIGIKEKRKMDIDVRKYIKDIEKQYAHIQNWKQPETLEEHLNTTIKYYEKLNKEKQMNEKVKKIIEDVCSFDGITEKEEEIIYQLFFYAIYLHDIGKINPKFQKDKMNNPWIKNVNNSSSEHSLPSSLIYIDIFSEKIEPLKNKRFLYVILYSFAYIISRHHSNLDDLEGEEFLSRLKKVKESGIYESYLYKERLMNINLDDNIYMNKNKLLNRYEVPEIAYYILNKMLYSLIVTCDYYATYEYMNSSDIDIEIIKDTDKFIEKYENTEIYQNIEKYRKDKTLLEENNINRLRSDIFIETEENLLKNLDKNIFYLEAPTGSGKTNTSINLALKILQNKREINNIFYIFPFNTLVEQTKKTLEKVFDYEKDFMCINSITPITQKTEENLDYNKIYLNYQFMNYPIILTSHVNMFSSFFGS